jgi:hypothetical protein
MGPAVQPALALSGEELAILVELIEAERTRLLIEIRHADHRSYREELHQRSELVEKLLARLQRR